MAKRSAIPGTSAVPDPFRTERDSMGALQVPAAALWGAQTQRAVQNFRISGQPMPRGFLRAMGLIKAAAAQANANLGLMSKTRAAAIRRAALAVAGGDHDDQFPVDIYQTGSGTSTNMNVNEVIAALVMRSGRGRIHPNDDVNLGQSSNDVIPAAIRVAALLATTEELLPALRLLRTTIDRRAREARKLIKTGRTHLMDAMPLTFAQELGAWSSQLESARMRIEDSLKRLRRLPIGGTAIGTGINTDPRFGKRVAQTLSVMSGVRFVSADDKFEGIAAQDDAVELSGQLSALAVALMKIANDLRWMNSGPLAGLGEIELPALQPGSSIMPGKINPTQSEALTMVAVQVFGNDTSVAFAGTQGHFQLNVFKPIMLHNVLESIELLSDGLRSFDERCARGIEPNRERIREHLDDSLMLVTALNPHIGYDKAAKIAKAAHAQGLSLRDAALASGFVTAEQFDAWVRAEAMVGRLPG